MIGASGSALSPCLWPSVSTSEPMTCRWCVLAARSRCRPVAEFLEPRVLEIRLNERFDLGNCSLDAQALMARNGVGAMYELKKHP